MKFRAFLCNSEGSPPLAEYVFPYYPSSKELLSFFLFHLGKNLEKFNPIAEIRIGYTPDGKIYIRVFKESPDPAFFPVAGESYCFMFDIFPIYDDLECPELLTNSSYIIREFAKQVPKYIRES